MSKKMDHIQENVYYRYVTRELLLLLSYLTGRTVQGYSWPRKLLLRRQNGIIVIIIIFIRS